MSQQAIATDAPEAPETVVAGLVTRARAAMKAFENADQTRVDEAVRALAWALYKPENARALAEQAVADTGLGNVPDKIVKNQRKTFGCLRDLLRARSVGIIEEDPARGLVVYAKQSRRWNAPPVEEGMEIRKGQSLIELPESRIDVATDGPWYHVRPERFQHGDPPKRAGPHDGTLFQ